MFEFWSHGVAVIVEYPERVTLLRHTGWGTLVEQLSDPPGRSNNWFHFALHSPRIIAERFYDAIPSLRFGSRSGSIRVVADANFNARISEIHLRYGDRLVTTRAVDLRGPHIDYTTNVNEPGVLEWPPTGLEAALALCLRVEFGNGAPRGQIIFRYAGVTYTHSNS